MKLASGLDVGIVLHERRQASLFTRVFWLGGGTSVYANSADPTEVETGKSRLGQTT